MLFDKNPISLSQLWCPFEHLWRSSRSECSTKCKEVRDGQLLTSFSFTVSYCAISLLHTYLILFAIFSAVLRFCMKSGEISDENLKPGNNCSIVGLLIHIGIWWDKLQSDVLSNRCPVDSHPVYWASIASKNWSEGVEGVLMLSKFVCHKSSTILPQSASLIPTYEVQDEVKQNTIQDQPLRLFSCILKK